MNTRDMPTRAATALSNLNWPALAALSALALVVVGWRIDFVPTTTMDRAGQLLAWLVTVPAGIVLYLRVTERHRLEPSLSWKRLFERLSAGLIPVVIWTSVYSIAAHTLPGMLTYATGNPTTLSVKARVEHQRSRRGCDYRLTSAWSERAFPAYLCLDDAPLRPVARPVRTRLAGQQGPLGFLFERALR